MKQDNNLTQLTVPEELATSLNLGHKLALSIIARFHGPSTVSVKGNTLSFQSANGANDTPDLQELLDKAAPALSKMATEVLHSFLHHKGLLPDEDVKIVLKYL